MRVACAGSNALYSQIYEFSTALLQVCELLWYPSSKSPFELKRVCVEFLSPTNQKPSRVLQTLISFGKVSMFFCLGNS